MAGDGTPEGLRDGDARVATTGGRQVTTSDLGQGWASGKRYIADVLGKGWVARGRDGTAPETCRFSGVRSGCVPAPPVEEILDVVVAADDRRTSFAN
jgi:hypothetical protein